MRNAGRGQRCDLSAGSSYKMKWGKRSNCSEEGIENSKAVVSEKHSIPWDHRRVSCAWSYSSLLEEAKKDEARSLTGDVILRHLGFPTNNGWHWSFWSQQMMITLVFWKENFDGKEENVQQGEEREDEKPRQGLEVSVHSQFFMIFNLLENSIPWRYCILTTGLDGL